MKPLIKHISFWILIAVFALVCVLINKSSLKKEEKMIVGVHVAGEVNAPGYYELPYGSRIKDALNYAGGEKKSADIEKVNLAMKLRDGEKIEIPKKGEDKEDASGKININTADLYQLCKLEGIGEKMASRIIAYRTQKGNFKNIDELKKVKGIGTENFNIIKNDITV